MNLLRRLVAPVAKVRTAKQQAGDAAETAACRYLVEQGCQIVARNQRYREGELDIVAQQATTLVFVEVRLRTDQRFGGAEASVDRAKQRRLIRAAQHYLLQHYGASGAGQSQRAWPACRFDVVTVNADGVTGWIKDAFHADE